jgi:hypothetical protein
MPGWPTLALSATVWRFWPWGQLLGTLEPKTRLHGSRAQQTPRAEVTP